MPKKILIVVLAPMLIFAVAFPVLAETGSDSDSQQSETAKKEAEAQHEAAKQAVEKKRESAKQAAEKAREAAKNKLEAAKEKLSENKLKICKDHEDGINNAMAAIAARGQEKIDVFTKITERTEAFYTSKGKILASYNDLVATVNTKKAAAQSAIDAAISSSVAFKCDGDNPKGAARDFKTKVKAMNNALKEYKTAVKKPNFRL